MTTIKIIENGPALISADPDLTILSDATMEVSHANKTELRNNTIALCRCGKSTNQPYCDSSHKQNQPSL